MTLKSYLKEKQIRISHLARSAGVPYSTLNDIVNGKTDIQMVRLGIVQNICRALSLGIDDFLRLCSDESIGLYIPNAAVIRKNKSFFLRYESRGMTREVRLCKINALNAEYLSYMAEETLKKLRNQEFMEAWT